MTLQRSPNGAGGARRARDARKPPATTLTAAQFTDAPATAPATTLLSRESSA
ncbi:hypothetical protein [Halosimplex marinum]|uniref:hypothetical protein n=1 Tax=Halosimplex marinum TaxID=3396620 RepID=UPI003F5556A5